MQINREEPEEIIKRIKPGVIALLNAEDKHKEAEIVKNGDLNLIIQSFSFENYQINLIPEDAVYIKNNIDSQKIIEEHLVTVSNGNLKDQNGGLVDITIKDIKFGIKI